MGRQRRWAWRCRLDHGRLCGCHKVSDQLRALRKVQRGQGLCKAALEGGDSGDHSGARIAAEGITQEQSELGVAVRHVRALSVGGEGRDHIAKRRERLVDAARLAQSHPARVRVLLPLRSCKVHEMKRGCAQALEPASAARLVALQLGGHLKGKHGVRARRLGVRIRAGRDTVGRGSCYEAHRVRNRRDRLLAQSLDMNAAAVALPHAQRWRATREAVRRRLLVELQE